MTALFRVEAVGGELRCDKNETLELRYFGKEELPEIYCKQHRDMIDDWFAERRGVFR